MDLRWLDQPKWWERLTLAEIEMLMVLDRLNRLKGNRTDTAADLRISVRTVRKRVVDLKRRGAEIPRFVPKHTGVFKAPLVKPAFVPIPWDKPNVPPPPLPKPPEPAYCLKHFYTTKPCPKCMLKGIGL